MLIVNRAIYKDISISVNGKLYTENIPTHIRLLDFLREVLHLTGTKEVCGEGECGACTVIMDGKAVNACLILAVEADGSEITNIEGLGQEKQLNELQQAFVDEHAVQCGYCIPGMVMSAEALKADGGVYSRDEIKHSLAGNICRCTGYAKIIMAVEKELGAR